MPTQLKLDPNSEEFKFYSERSKKCQTKRYETYRRKFQETLDEKFGKNDYRLLTKVYRGNTKRYMFRHSCGYKFEAQGDTLLKGGTKCKCLLAYNKHLTTAEHNEELRELRGPDYYCIEYLGSAKQNTYKHVPCGTIWTSTRSNLINMKICPTCSGENGVNLHRISYEEFKRKFKKLKLHREYRVVKSTYNGISKLTKFRHHKGCGKYFECKPYEMFNRGAGCTHCQTGTLHIIKDVYVDEKLFRLRGYEPYALDMLLKKYTADQIIGGITRDIPIIDYKLGKKNHKYYPDFYIPHHRLIVEVKSIATLGLSTYMEALDYNAFERTKAKANYCHIAGYRFQLYLIHNRKRLKIPNEWFFMSKEEFIERLFKRNPGFNNANMREQIAT